MWKNNLMNGTYFKELFPIYVLKNSQRFSALTK